MSLAVTTSTVLTIIEAATLKRHATSCDAQRTSMTTTPSAATWSPDNSTLYLATSDAILSLASSSQLVSIYSAPKGSALQPVLVSRDKYTLIFAQGSAIHLLTVGSGSPKITNSLIGHSSPVTSLSLCNDASLLASSSASGTLCVHNLVHNSLTVLKGLSNTPGGMSKNLICAFHPHTRTRLLVGFGKTLAVYDTTRPSGPLKTIPLTEKEVSGAVPNIGHVVAISCSPFSKTLTAVAFNTGFIALVDLEKDRPFFKNIQLKVPVTSMLFTPDGSSIVLGTENGKVIIKDLRSMEHDHRTLPVADEGSGERVIGLAIQRRIKHISPTSIATKSASSPRKMPSSLSAPLASQDLNNAAGAKSPRRRIVSSSPTAPKTRTNFATPLKSRTTNLEPSKRALSPPKVALTENTSGDISIQLDTLMNGGGHSGKKASMKHTDTENLPASKPRLSGLRSNSSAVTTATSPSSRSRPASTAADRPSRSNASSRVGSTKSSGRSVISPVGRPSTQVSPGRRTERSNGSRSVLESVSRNTLSPREPATQVLPESVKHTNTQVRSGSTQMLHAGQIRRASNASTARTPTPEFPSMSEETPLWGDQHKQRGYASRAQMLATPEVERWVEAGEGKPSTGSENAMNVGRKHVGWADSDVGNSLSESEDGRDEDEPTVSASLYKGKNLPDSKSINAIPGSARMTPLRRPHVSPGALQLSPLRHSPLYSSSAGGNNLNGGGQDLLRAVVNDIMYEYRQETKDDIKGLHLDLIRMGRSWKNELRTLMQEYVGDLKDLRDENARLRKENDRLRQTF